MGPSDLLDEARSRLYYKYAFKPLRSQAYLRSGLLFFQLQLLSLSFRKMGKPGIRALLTLPLPRSVTSSCSLVVRNAVRQLWKLLRFVFSFDVAIFASSQELALRGHHVLALSKLS